MSGSLRFLTFGSFGGRLFQKLKIPQVVGYIVIGIIIGSSGFKILGDKLINSLDPINTIALSLIGFLVGAELKVDVIKKYGKQFVGILLGETTVPFFVVAVLVGGATFIITKNATYSLSLGLPNGSRNGTNILLHAQHTTSTARSSPVLNPMPPTSR